jgi:hypothetical protein
VFGFGFSFGFSFGFVIGLRELVNVSMLFLVLDLVCELNFRL